MIQSTVPEWFLALLLAPAVGSFAGVVIERLPQGKPFLIARSECRSCRVALQWRDLVPIVSYFYLRGRCRKCQSKIDPFHLVVECAAFTIAGWASAFSVDSLTLWSNCLLGWSLLVLSWIDARHLRLPDVITLPLLIAGIIVQFLVGPERMLYATIGALCGYASFWIIGRIYAGLRGREGLGHGDAKLLAVAGAWTSWEALPLIVVMSAVIALSGIFILNNGRLHDLTKSTIVPFGPAIAISLWLIRVHDISF